jgi:hypothetical protein
MYADDFCWFNKLEYFGRAIAKHGIVLGKFEACAGQLPDFAAEPRRVNVHFINAARRVRVEQGKGRNLLIKFFTFISSERGVRRGCKLINKILFALCEARSRVESRCSEVASASPTDAGPTLASASCKVPKIHIIYLH